MKDLYQFEFQNALRVHPDLSKNEPYGKSVNGDLG